MVWGAYGRGTNRFANASSDCGGSAPFVRDLLQLLVKVQCVPPSSEAGNISPLTDRTDRQLIPLKILAYPPERKRERTKGKTASLVYLRLQEPLLYVNDASGISPRVSFLSCRPEYSSPVFPSLPIEVLYSMLQSVSNDFCEIFQSIPSIGLYSCLQSFTFYMQCLLIPFYSTH